MKGDFTRRTFRHRNHYRGVLLQQGRVALDADWNEQVEIQERLDRTTTRDTVGRHGTPAEAAGMEVVCASGDVTKSDCKETDLRISPGRYYVDGILCENEKLVPLTAQPDLPGVTLPKEAGRYIAYLDVWAEHVTMLERPELREVALGGPDTATRTRTIWQVRLVKPKNPPDGCPPEDPPFTPELARGDPTGTPGKLRARAKAPDDDPEPCAIPTTARYRRLENQLYRVEIRTGGSPEDKRTYLWSRENGSVAARLLTVAGNVLTIDAAGRDERLGFARDNWVEVTDSARGRRGEKGFLAQLDEADGTKLTVHRWLDDIAPTNEDLGPGKVVRRWDSEGELTVGAGWVNLEDGVQVEFDGGMYRTGDYWLIPARSASLTGNPVDPDLVGNVEWPRDGDKAVFRRPVGIKHHYAPLAVLELGYGGWRRLYDCRIVFPPLSGPKPGLDHAPGLHVTGVVLRDEDETPLLNDSVIAAEDLAGGIAVLLDDAPAATTVDGKPVLQFTVDLPYPFSQSDRDLWYLGQSTDEKNLIGTMPLALGGEVALDQPQRGPAITWMPAEGSAEFLPRLLTMMGEFHRGNRVLCHLTLTGRAVAADDGRVVNGLAVGRPAADGTTELVLPTVDDVHGADFTMWFWLAQPSQEPVPQ